MPSPAYRYAATVLRWIDGDTCTVAVDLGWHLTLRCTVRLTSHTGGVDAAERGTPKGQAAWDRVRVLAPIGTGLTLHSHRIDKYGRTLGVLVLDDGTDVGVQLVAEGLAVAWDGRGPRPAPL